MITRAVALQRFALRVRGRCKPTHPAASSIHFWVNADGTVIGKLEVSKVSLVWYPKGLRYGHKMSWAELDHEAKKYPRREKRKG